MRNLETYHHNFLEAGTHTFELNANPKYELLIKNLTSKKIVLSYGTEIDTTKEPYVEMIPNTAEIIPYKSNGNNPVKITVTAEGTGTVEIRILDD